MKTKSSQQGHHWSYSLDVAYDGSPILSSDMRRRSASAPPASALDEPDPPDCVPVNAILPQEEAEAVLTNRPNQLVLNRQPIQITCVPMGWKPTLDRWLRSTPAPQAKANPVAPRLRQSKCPMLRAASSARRGKLRSSRNSIWPSRQDSIHSMGPNGVETLQQQQRDIPVLVLAAAQQVLDGTNEASTAYMEHQDWDGLAREGEDLIRRTEQVMKALHGTTKSMSSSFPPGHDASLVDNGSASFSASCTCEEQSISTSGVYRARSARAIAISKLMSLYAKKLDIITSFITEVRPNLTELEHTAAVLRLDLELTITNSFILDAGIAKLKREGIKPNELPVEATPTTQMQSGADAGTPQDAQFPSHSTSAEGSRDTNGSEASKDFEPQGWLEGPARAEAQEEDSSKEGTAQPEETAKEEEKAKAKNKAKRKKKGKSQRKANRK